MPTRRLKEIAWDKPTPIPGKDPNLYRRDRFGNEIYKHSYGMQGPKSWEVDHSNPKSNGGTDSPRNLQAMQTRANRQKGDKYPYPGINSDDPNNLEGTELTRTKIRVNDGHQVPECDEASNGERVADGSSVAHQIAPESKPVAGPVGQNAGVAEASSKPVVVPDPFMNRPTQSQSPELNEKYAALAEAMGRQRSKPAPRSRSSRRNKAGMRNGMRIQLPTVKIISK